MWKCSIFRIRASESRPSIVRRRFTIDTKNRVTLHTRISYDIDNFSNRNLKKKYIQMFILQRKHFQSIDIF